MFKINIINIVLNISCIITLESLKILKKVNKA